MSAAAASDLLRVARLRAVADQPYLAAGLHRLVLVESSSVPTMAVSARWRCYYNPATVERWTVPERAAVLVHELWHLLRDHHARAEGCKADPQAWNIAADCEINDDLQGLPAGGVYPSTIGQPDGLTAEQYLPAAQQQKPKQGEGEGAGDEGGEGQPGDGSPSPWGGSAADGKGRPWESAEDTLGDDPAPSATESKLIARQIAKDAQEFAGKNPGKVPGGVLRWAGDILAPPVVPWQKELAACLRGAMAQVSGAVDWSSRRPSRRQSIFGEIIMPALVRPVPRVAVVVDTSGSMSESDLAACLVEVRGILGALGGMAECKVIACDSAAAPAQRVMDARRVRLIGGGGTDMAAGIEAAAALRPRPDVLAILTDGHTPWPAAAPQGIRCVTLVTNFGRGPNWGRVVYKDSANKAAAAARGRP